MEALETLARAVEEGARREELFAKLVEERRTLEVLGAEASYFTLLNIIMVYGVARMLHFICFGSPIACPNLKKTGNTMPQTPRVEEKVRLCFLFGNVCSTGKHVLAHRLDNIPQKKMPAPISVWGYHTPNLLRALPRKPSPNFSSMFKHV